MRELVWTKGRILTADAAVVPFRDEGFSHGFGLFETLRVCGGRPFMLREHLQRMTSSAKELGIGTRGIAAIPRIVDEVIEAAGSASARLRITLTKGTPPGLFVEVRRLRVPSPADCANGVTAVVWPHPRPLASPLLRHKTLCYAENMLAREFANSKGAYEAVFVNSAGNVAEGAMTNLFWVRGREVFTPSLSANILPGVTRDVVTRLCRVERIPCREKNARLSDLRSADEAFLTNSVIGILSLVRMNGRRISTGRPGELTRQLTGRYGMTVATATGRRDRHGV